MAKNLLHMHHHVHEMSTHRKRLMYSVAVTVPPIKQLTHPWKPSIEPSRRALNQELRSFALTHNDHVAFLDLEDYFSVANVTDSAERARRIALWSYDEVHLSAAGYDEMGSQLYRTIAEFHHKRKHAERRIF